MISWTVLSIPVLNMCAKFKMPKLHCRKHEMGPKSLTKVSLASDNDSQVNSKLHLGYNFNYYKPHTTTVASRKLPACQRRHRP